MTDQEKKDLDEMLEATAKLKLASFDYLTMLSGVPEQDLVIHGHKSFGAACVYNIRSTNKQIDALMRKHLVKYPD